MDAKVKPQRIRRTAAKQLPAPQAPPTPSVAPMGASSPTAMPDAVAPVRRHRCLICSLALAFLLVVYVVTAVYKPEQLSAVFACMVPVLIATVCAAMGVRLPKWAAKGQR